VETHKFPPMQYFGSLVGILVGIYFLCELFNLTGGLLFLKCTIAALIGSLCMPIISDIHVIFSGQNKK